MLIAGAFVESAASDCCGNAARNSSAGTSICMTAAGCSEFTCEAAQTILKRLMVHAGAANLGLLMRKLFGVGTPRAIQSRLGPVFSLIANLKRAIRRPRPLKTSEYGRFLNHSGIHAVTFCVPFAA